MDVAHFTERGAGGGGETTMLQVLVTVLLAELPDESTALAVKLNVPALDGVPVIAPVDALSVKPAGREPELME